MNYLLVFILSSFMIVPMTNAKVQPIAHRGASGYAPENNLSAIKKALELNSTYIEIDVHMTSDGEVVSIHDSSIDRTSNKSGKVNDYSLSQLKSFDFGSWYDEKFKEERIPSLKEVLEITAEKAVLIIELKYGSDDYKGIEEKIVNLIKEMNLSENVILKSFSLKILNKFEKIAPNMKRLYCTFGGNSWITLDNFLRFKGIFEGASFQYLQVHKYFLSENLIRKAHEKNIKVVVWDVHDEKSMQKFSKMGVDFIESDYPDLVLKIQL